jgi:undecaprenyl-diphosphatase
MTLRRIIELDARLSSRLRVAEMPGFRRTVAMILAHSGDSWFWGAALVVIWLLSDAFWKRWAIVMLAAVSVLAGVVMGLKFIIRRRRPEGNWGSIYRNTDPHSFPSGHAARAFLIAVLAMALGPAGLAIALWIWAPLVSLARVAMGVHYLSDVAAGSIFGAIAGLVAWQLSEPFLSWLTRTIGVPLW